LIKKDWDDMVIVDEGRPEATDFHGGHALKLADISQIENSLEFFLKDYDETQIDPDVAQTHIEELMNFPSEKDYREQRSRLKGEQQEDWVKFCNKQKKLVEKEVAIHQASSVIPLGWDPAVDT
jgi:hypothetical protein